MIDALMEECSVDLADRIPLLQLLFDQYDPRLRNDVSKQAAIKQQLGKIEARGAKILKLKELMKIRGSCDQVNEQLQQKQHIFCKSRFVAVIDYFRKLEEKLELFDITSEKLIKEDE